MKNIIKYTLSMLMLIAMVVTPGCVTEEQEGWRVDGETFIMKLSLTGTKLDTKTNTTEDGDSDGSLNENVINKLDVFFYDGPTLKWHAATQVVYDQTTGKATLPVASDKRSLFNNNTTISYDVYVVANNTADLGSIREGENNLDKLKNLVFQSQEFVRNGGAEPQSSFVMDGKISKTINLKSPDLGTVNLKRAASKIRMRLTQVNVPGYTVDESIGITARLVHFTDKSVLLDEGEPATIESSELQNTPERDVSTSLDHMTGTTTGAPFYSYENDWSKTPSFETYIELFVPLKDNKTEATATYRYRVPVTPQDLSGKNETYKNRLYRNHLYDIDVIVNILGGTEERPVEIAGNYTIKDWGTQEVFVNIKGTHYLALSERNSVMANVTGYELTFNSSIPDVKMVEGSLKATFTYVYNSDDGDDKIINASGDQIPKISVAQNVMSGKITIESKIPVNFIPKDIEFQITNGQLTETVNIRQLPSTYFTDEKGERSSLLPDGKWKPSSPKQKNKSMYIITSLVPSGIIWGFPPVDQEGTTLNTIDVSRMVSPKFMMASQYGATKPMGYPKAKENCQNYWEETTINGQTVRYDNWRLPTEAELRYIDDLQHNKNNPLGVLMTGKFYWDAYDVNDAYLMKDGDWSWILVTKTNAYVRCVRDIKD